MQVKLAEAQVELDNRNITIRQIQRNYENLSAAFEARAQELDAVRRCRLTPAFLYNQARVFQLLESTSLSCALVSN